MRRSVAQASVSKISPALVQLVLLAIVGHTGSLSSVGVLAAASATAFFCGALGEAGFTSTLSTPMAYFGVQSPPLRATAAVRWVLALGASFLYVAICAFGLARSNPLVLILIPLPATLALSYGYSGVLNAEGRLRIEAWVTLAESVAILVIAGTATLLGVSPIAGACAGLSVGRFAGLAVRRAYARRGVEEPLHVSGVARTAYQWLAINFAVVLQGQLDMLLLGALSALVVSGQYGPLLRAAYSGALLGEAGAWSLYPSRVRVARDRSNRAFFVFGLVLALGFAALAPTALSAVIGQRLGPSAVCIAALSVAIVLKMGAYALSIDLVRTGRQFSRIPGVALGLVPLAVGAALSAHDGTLAPVALGRVASEAIVLGWLAWVAGFRARRRRRREVQPGPVVSQ